MNDIVENPFGRGQSAMTESAGARQLQARENTEVMAMAMMAKRFPRDMIRACDRILNAFSRLSLAEKAQYQFARGGTDIVGPSIRAAEAMAQQWGNLSNGWREVSRFVGADGVGVSEIEAFCVDYESTSRESIQFVVRHWRDTQKGGYKLKDERDIYELCANQAQRRKRACILAQIPGDVQEMAMQQTEVTLRSKADTSPEAVARLVAAFAPFGVAAEQIEKRIQRKLDAIQPAQIISLRRIYASLRDEMSAPEDWFDVKAEPVASTGIDAVKAAAQAAKGPASAVPPAEPAAVEVAAAAAATTKKAKKADDPNPEAGKAEKSPTITTLEQRLAAIEGAKNGEAAALELDAARGLGVDEQKVLVEAYNKKWGL